MGRILYNAKIYTLNPQQPLISAIFIGEGGPFFIGPERERWDRAMLVRQSSVQNFLAFASHEGYLAGYGHRLAAVEDSRLLPLLQMPPVAGGKHAA